jgi:hypothetical protein
MANRRPTFQNIDVLLRELKRRGSLGKDYGLTPEQITFFRQNPEAYWELPLEAKAWLEQQIKPTTREKWFGGGERRTIEQMPNTQFQQQLQGQIQPELIQNLLPQFLQQLSPEYQQQQQALQQMQFMQNPLTQMLINPQAKPQFPDQQIPQQAPQGVDIGALSSMLMPFAQQFGQSQMGQDLRGYLENKAQGVGNKLMSLLGRR